jgi:hypothetical protein
MTALTAAPALDLDLEPGEIICGECGAEVRLIRMEGVS